MLARWDINAVIACEIVTLLHRMNDLLSVWKNTNALVDPGLTGRYYADVFHYKMINDVFFFGYSGEMINLGHFVSYLFRGRLFYRRRTAEILFLSAFIAWSPSVLLPRNARNYVQLTRVRRTRVKYKCVTQPCVTSTRACSVIDGYPRERNDTLCKYRSALVTSPGITTARTTRHGYWWRCLSRRVTWEMDNGTNTAVVHLHVRLM